MRDLTLFNDYMPPLETSRLLIRRLTMHDAADIFEYSRDPLVAKHVLWDAQKSIGEARSYIRYTIRKYHSCQCASWGIVLKETGHVIGTIGFMWIHDDDRSAEVGYSLARNQWNKGLMTEALQAVLKYGFDVLGLNRIEAQYECDNEASGAVMRKCGMTREGLLRQRLFNKGKFVDVELYAILKCDYRAQHSNAKH